MNKTNTLIRSEKPQDYRAVETLVRDSFWNIYRPGCTEHFTLKKLRQDADFVPQLDFVMEQDGRIIGQNVFVKAAVEADDGRTIPVLTMGPICIANDYKRHGYGKKLLDYSLQQAAALGFGAVCLEGDIGFYGKSGFTFAGNYGIRYNGMPADAGTPFFLCKELRQGYLAGIAGNYMTPKGYFACEQFAEEFAAYEAGFPYKEKQKNPGQL